MRWIENAARDWYRFASVWGLWFLGAIIWWSQLYPKEYGELLDYIPQPWRSLVLFVVFAIGAPVLRVTSFKRPG